MGHSFPIGGVGHLTWEKGLQVLSVTKKFEEGKVMTTLQRVKASPTAHHNLTDGEMLCALLAFGL